MTPTHDELITAVATYQVPDAARQLLDEQMPLILCGITAAGKDTLAQELVAEGGFETVVSHTTRQPRPNHGVLEQDGIGYFFIDEQTMLTMVSEEAFIEVKLVHDWVYGTSIAAYKAPFTRGNQPVLVIDVQGAEELVTAAPHLQPIFLLPPSIAVWEERLQNRGTLDAEALRSRMQSAVKEIQTIMHNPAFQLIVNTDKVETAAILRAGHTGRDSNAVELANQLVSDLQQRLQDS